MDTIFPDDFYLTFPSLEEGRVGRVNWLRRLSTSPYVIAGVTYVDDGGCEMWILHLVDNTLTPLFPHLRFTEEEEVKIIEMLKVERSRNVFV